MRWVGTAVAVVAITVCGAVLLATRQPKVRAAGVRVDPGATIIEMAAGLRPDGAYRAPSREERDLAERGAGALRDLPQARSVFEKLGFSLVESTDPATGRRFALFTSRDSWGAVLVDLSADSRVLVGVPHPGSDLRSEQLGVDVFRAVPGSILLVAGAHRRAGGGDADVAHNPKSLFHVVATRLARTGLPQVQVHGFADRNLPGADVVVSTGSADRGALPARIADRIGDAGFATCRAWTTRCGRLEGATNVQGQAAEELGVTFVHLEVSWSVRATADTRAALSAAVAAALP